MSNVSHRRYSDAEAADAAPVQSVNGKTGDVTVQNPIRRTDVAETWAESDVSLNLGHGVQMASERVSLMGSAGPVTADFGGLGSGYAYTGNYGIVVTPSTDLNSISGTVAGPIGSFTKARVIRVSDGTVIKETSISGLSSGDTVSMSAKLHAGTDYAFCIVGDGSGEVPYESKSFPFDTSLFSVPSGYNGGSIDNTNIYVWSDVTASRDAVLSGDATVAWPQPEDLREWDVATFIASPDGETVTVDVLDGAGNVLQTNIPRGYDLAADADIADADNLQLRANLSRASTANNPTIDALYRAWNV